MSIESTTLKPKTGSERQWEYRERRKAEGWKQTPIWFSPEAQAVLDALPSDVTKEQFINDAITSAWNLIHPDAG